ncbi:MAG: helix-turn-helix transcriptional regulator [Clostridia bacterium]|nr:helix-turn-helix transcriptional regulator [Clostridia bacterium]
MTIGQKLADMRRRAGLTQDYVSEHLGVTPQAVSKWENDVSCPDITLLPEIAKIYHTTVDDLLNGEATKEVAVIDETVRKDPSEMVLHIHVEDHGDKVKINLPLALVVLMSENDSMGSFNIGNIDLKKIDFKSILSMVHSGVIGKLVEIESADGGTVIIEVE